MDEDHSNYDTTSSTNSSGDTDSRDTYTTSGDSSSENTGSEQSDIQGHDDR